MCSADRGGINECKTTLKDNARRWREEGVSSVTIVSAFAESMAEIGISLVGPRPTVEILQYLDQKIQSSYEGAEERVPFSDGGQP